jgi:hypothetical protein
MTVDDSGFDCLLDLSKAAATKYFPLLVAQLRVNTTIFTGHLISIS